MTDLRTIRVLEAQISRLEQAIADANRRADSAQGHPKVRDLDLRHAADLSGQLQRLQSHLAQLRGSA